MVLKCKLSQVITRRKHEIYVYVWSRRNTRMGGLLRTSKEAGHYSSTNVLETREMGNRARMWKLSSMTLRLVLEQIVYANREEIGNRASQCRPEAANI